MQSVFTTLFIFLFVLGVNAQLPSFSWDKTNTLLHFRKVERFMNDAERERAIRMSNMIVLEKIHATNESTPDPATNPADKDVRLFSEHTIRYEAKELRRVAVEMDAENGNAYFQDNLKILFYWNATKGYPAYSYWFREKELELAAGTPPFVTFTDLAPESETFWSDTSKYEIVGTPWNSFSNLGTFRHDYKQVPSFRDWWVDRAIEMLKPGVNDTFNNGVYNGITGDDGLDGLFVDAVLQSTQADMNSLLSDLDSELSSNTDLQDKLVIYNGMRHAGSTQTNGDHDNFTDGVYIEHFNQFSSTSAANIKADIDGIASYGGSDIVVAKSWPGIDGNYTKPDFLAKTSSEILTIAQNNLEFNLAAFLMGAQEHSYFIYSWGYVLEEHGVLQNYDLMDMPLGDPIGAYQENGGPYKLKREFKYADVSVDLEDSSSADIFWKKPWCNNVDQINEQDQISVLSSGSDVALTEDLPIATIGIVDRFANAGTDKTVVYGFDNQIIDDRIIDHLRFKVKVRMNSYGDGNATSRKMKVAFISTNGGTSFSKVNSFPGTGWKDFVFDFRDAPERFDLKSYEYQLHITFGDGDSADNIYDMGEIKGVALDLVPLNDEDKGNYNTVGRLPYAVSEATTNYLEADGQSNAELTTVPNVNINVSHESTNVFQYKMITTQANGNSSITYDFKDSFTLIGSDETPIKMKVFQDVNNTTVGNFKVRVDFLINGVKIKQFAKFFRGATALGTNEWHEIVLDYVSANSTVQDPDVNVYDGMRLTIQELDNDLVTSYTTTNNKYYFDDFYGPALEGDTASVKNVSMDKASVAVGIYPNPVNDFFRLSKKAISVKVYSIGGELIDVLGAAASNGYDASNLNSGLYFLSLELEDGTKEVARMLKL